MPTSHGDLPATRADVRALEVKLEGRLQRLEDKMDRLEDKMDAIIRAIAQSQAETLERTQEMVRDAQTELLRGFSAFADGQNTRIRKQQADLSNVDASTDLRLVVLERRLLEIEPRLPPIPPAPPAA
jgi:exonuclease VII large subunit